MKKLLFWAGAIIIVASSIDLNWSLTYGWAGSLWIYGIPIGILFIFISLFISSADGVSHEISLKKVGYYGLLISAIFALFAPWIFWGLIILTKIFYPDNGDGSSAMLFYFISIPAGLVGVIISGIFIGIGKMRE